MEDKKILYRYDTDLYTLKPTCYRFEVVRETECGYWIKDYVPDGELGRLYTVSEKWINKFAGRKWAENTKEQALMGFTRRKTYQINILENKLTNIRRSLSLAEKLKEKLEI